MKKPLNELVPRLARGARPSAAVASGLLAPLAMGAPGDLDPGFADAGRLAQIIDLEGPIWSVEALDDGSVLVAGGDVDMCSWYSWYCYYDPVFEATNFVSQLTAEGSVDPAFNAARPAGIEVRDAARQSDGKVIAVGRRVVQSSNIANQFVVYRLESGGSMDTTFGLEGIFELSGAVHGTQNSASAVVLEPDGRIVVSGSRGDQLIVLRLLSDGTLDNSFGDFGVFIGPLHDNDAGAHIVRTAAGGYRVTKSGESQCRIIGLTAGGEIDNSFGTAGIAPVATPLGNASLCNAITALADDRLIAIGTAGGQGFAAGLLATGGPDPTFMADAVAEATLDVTAIEVADDGRILVAGSGIDGSKVMRLLAGGGLDTSFGNEGSTIIDLPSEFGSEAVFRDLALRPDGSVLAAGGDYVSDAPFLIRLLGDGAGDSPGVLSVVQSGAEAAEGDQVVLNVRRSGGKSGAVSVDYETAPGDWPPASAGQDYDNVAGVLTWDDGDTSTREIVVPVHNDASAEEHEQFRIALSNAQGGAGIGTRNWTARILADGAPAGQFALYDSNQLVGENGLVQVWVYRNFYYDGAVSVTVTPVAGTAAAGSDFVADPVTVSWADQDFDGKLVEIGIVDDAAQEGSESFTIELSNPTGGAVIGPHSDDAITISANDTPRPSRPNRGGGGGSTGFLSLLLLGLAELFRALQRKDRILL